MQDPQPENIEGMMEEVHRFEHSINWGHLVLGLAIIVFLIQFGPPLLDVFEASGDDGEEDQTYV